MNDNIDLTKILKNCPEGTIFWSDNYGEVRFKCIEKSYKYTLKYPILVERTDGHNEAYTKEGWCDIYFPASCLLWPSKYCRDWSKFTAPWYKKEKLFEPKFKVGDKIVNVPMKYMKGSGAKGIISKITDDKYIFTDGSYMFISNQDSWKLDQEKFDPKTLQPFDKVLVRDNEYDEWKVDFYSHNDINRVHPYICAGSSYVYCIPYNDDTKYLIGTTEEAPEYYRYWED